MIPRPPTGDSQPEGQSGDARPGGPGSGETTTPYSADGPNPTWVGPVNQPVTPPRGLPTASPAPAGVRSAGTSHDRPSGAPVGMPAPSGPGGSVGTRTRDGQWSRLAVTGIVAALLASGCTYVATTGQLEGSATNGTAIADLGNRDSGLGAVNTAQPVVQANADAPNWTATASAVSPSVVAISIATGSQSGQGSGVIIDNKGHIITNNHVVSGGTGSVSRSTRLQVVLADKRTYDATVVGTDPASDLAVIKIENAPKDLAPIAFGDDSKLRVGDQVMAVGNPLGLAGTVTTGIVSSLNRPVVATAEQREDPWGQWGRTPPQQEAAVTNAIQISAAINPGNSGGALVNANGQLIGINSSIATMGSNSGSIGIGFAIPVGLARTVADQLISSGEAQHGFLGVSSRDAVVQDGQDKRAAAGLTEITEGSPAANSGLRAGDAIISVDGEAVDSQLSLVAQIRERPVGDTVTLTIVREGKRSDVEVKLGTPS